MFLRDDLREFGLLDLLSLAFATRKSGTLVVRAGSVTVESQFQEGQLADVRLDGVSSVFADAVVRAGSVTPEQVSGAVASQSATHPAYASTLLRVSELSREELQHIATERALQIFDHMVIWPEGSFAFDTVATPEPPARSLELEMAGVLDHVRARLQEWKRLQAVWPDLDASLAMAPGARDRREPIAFGSTEWATVVRLCEQPSLRRLATQLALDEFEVREIADLLRARGIVQARINLSALEVPTPAAEAAPTAPETSEAEGRRASALSGLFESGRR